MLIKYIYKENLISLIFINLFSEMKMNFMNINRDFLKNSSEISEYYKNLIDIFSKKKIILLLSLQDHLDHHISLINNTKSIFDSIYNLSENEFKVFKKYFKDKFFKDFIYSSIFSFGLSILFIKKSDDNLYLYINYQIFNQMIIKN